MAQAADGLPYGEIQLVFTDLDGTLYPGAHEVEPASEKRGLMANMEQVAMLEARGLPVVPATGNNVGFAQLKMLDPRTGAKLRDLSTAPGIYCNGALVKGAGGREVAVRSLETFLPGFTDQWLAAGRWLARTPVSSPPPPGWSYRRHRADPQCYACSTARAPARSAWLGWARSGSSSSRTRGSHRPAHRSPLTSPP